ncbi:SLC13 family permease [Echinicola strongylocentroti]|uniref:SLC13 family permease n=1 Tax=Echinicola strongylocentroti TaxID=1795355 RepID=A0A2Z4IP67_9BACT|nr:SLC13 family permease [Echinicola strongylocentroti]AWW32550.1 SLC13 family permease [Echinicola strongylocentroti]
MTAEIITVLAIVAIAMVLFLTEKWSIDTVSIMVMVSFMVTGILTFEEGVAGFSNPATITVGAMFVISAAVFRTGSLNTVNIMFLRMRRKSEFVFMLALMVFSGVLSAFINDTAVVALLMPAVLKIAKDTGIAPSKLLMPLSFGALMGGVCTLLGTSTNILVSGIAQSHGVEPFGIFEMSGMGLVFLATGIAYMVLIGQWIIPKRQPSRDISETFDMGDYITEIFVTEKFEDTGKSIKMSRLFTDYNMDPIQIIRKTGEVINAYKYTVIREEDTIRVRCDKDTLTQIRNIQGIELKIDLKLKDEDFRSQGHKLYEMVVPPNSSLINNTVKSIDFRRTYPGLTVLAIRHRNDILHTKLKNTKISAGDVLLVRGDEEMVDQLKGSDHLLVISENATPRMVWKKIAFTLFIVVAVVTVAALKWLPIPIAAILGVVLLILFKSISSEEAYRSIDWKVLFMLAGILSMGTALEKTGAASLLATTLVDQLGSYGPRTIMSAVFLVTFLSTNVMSNNATAALLAPIAISIANTMEVSDRPYLMAVTFAASLSFMTPMGYQTNTMIYTPGNYKFMDYVKVGTPLNILYWIIATICIPMFFPF